MRTGYLEKLCSNEDQQYRYTRLIQFHAGMLVTTVNL